MSNNINPAQLNYEVSNLPLPTETVRALSWKQPYATAMLCGKIETRRWHTNYRGWVLICTSKAPYTMSAATVISGGKFLIKMLRKMKELDAAGHIDFNGYAIGIAKLVDCYKMQPSDADKCYVQFSPDLYCHVYENAMMIEPFEWKGSQGWRTLTPEQIDLIKPFIQ
jgi:hypothetical protein